MKSWGETAAMPSKQFVLDCSIVFSWFFADEADEYADSVALALSGWQAIVPALWAIEVANTLVSGERQRRSTEAQSSGFLARLSELPIILDSQDTNQIWSNASTLARAYGLSCYDAAYLEIAIRRSIPIATLDKQLKAAAASAGVPLFSA